MKIRYVRTYPHPIAAVWQALTDARAIRQWWVDTDFVAEPGRAFFFRDEARGGWDGIVRGRVIALDAPRMVRFTWSGGGHETEVSYELTPTADGGTRLTLTHAGFKGLSGLFLSTMLRFGWRGFVTKDLPAMAEHIARFDFARPFAKPPKAHASACAGC